MKNPNRYGTCYKLSGKRRNPYIARAYTGKDKDGKPIYETIGCFKTKTEGMKALLEYNNNPYDINKSKLTLNEIYNLWLLEYEEKIKPNTLKTLNQGFNMLEPLHHEIFKNIKPIEYQHIIDIKGKEYSKSHVNKIKKFLRRLYAFAVLQDIIDKDYSQYLEGAGEETGEQEYYTEIEVARMIKLAPVVENTDIILTLCFMGLRPEELFNITKFNVDLKNKMIFGIGVKTEAGEKKRVPISEILLPYFKKRYEETNNYIFSGSKGRKLYYSYFMDIIYKPCLKRLKIPYKPPKAGRHFFATISNQAGVNEKARTSMIGHTDINFTNDTYTHSQDLFLKKEYEKIDKLFKNL